VGAKRAKAPLRGYVSNSRGLNKSKPLGRTKGALLWPTRSSLTPREFLQCRRKRSLNDDV